MVEKVKLWIKETGLTNVGWGIAFVAALLMKLPFIAGISVGVFALKNYQVLLKLVKNIEL